MQGGHLTFHNVVTSKVNSMGIKCPQMSDLKRKKGTRYERKMICEIYASLINLLRSGRMIITTAFLPSSGHTLTPNTDGRAYTDRLVMGRLASKWG